ncbi:branched-chain amino acid ABC transporter permease [Pseudonocardia kujensis]|uniref:branched-chain amino acid ABC transporter permease n=1 Tax=Pseudonocardia kujensis TaxID=1128675 RepID=UPI001E51F698|nr:branched-chain amino acid ABC transporter permease [Pseudonocardia kujensis]MCE0765079.1 branched-chain amino acid ABC transporter permease [Pseudonocardia kujensis]
MTSTQIATALPRDRRVLGVQTWTVAAVALAALALAYFGFAVTSPYRLDIAMTFTMYSLLALGMYVPLFLGGNIDLAYNAYYAAGAYSVALVGARTHLPLLVAVPIGALIAAVLALVVGLATTHLSGFHLALATMLAGLAVYRWISSTGAEITGGADGIGGIPRLEVLGVEFDRELLVAVGFLAVWLVALCLSRFRRALPGLSVRLNRASPAAAEAAGVPTRSMKLMSLMSGAAIASLGGTFIALMNQFILADSFSHDIVFLILFLPMLGGIASPWGAVIGAALLVLLNEASSLLEGPGPLIFGGASLLILILLPGGLLGIAATTWSTWARRSRGSFDD